MTPYGYVALNRAGKEIKGSITAADEQEVMTALKAKGLTVISISKQSVFTQDLNINFGDPVKPRDLAVFCRQFVSMLKAGVSIVEAMKMLAESTENKALRSAIEGVTSEVQKGSSLADAMEDYPKVFPNIMINTIAAGEASGSLETAFDRVATQHEASARIKAAVKKAMIYPIIVGIVAVAVTIFMLVAIIPQYKSLFASLGTDLPGITQAVVSASDFLRTKWYIMLIIVGLVVGLIRYYAGTKKGKHFFGALQIKLPLFGKLAQKQACSLLARTLSTLLSSGVPLEEAVEVTARVMPNILYKEALLDARNQILQGVPLSRPLEDCGLFPPMMYHMVRIGEESGSTEDMLTKMADYYDEEVEQATASLMAAMEPLIIIVLAVVVGTLVISCIAPMLKMYQSLDGL